MDAAQAKQKQDFILLLVDTRTRGIYENSASFLSRRDVVIVRKDGDEKSVLLGDSHHSGITSADLGGSSDYSSESERESKWRRVS